MFKKRIFLKILPSFSDSHVYLDPPGDESDLEVDHTPAWYEVGEGRIRGEIQILKNQNLKIKTVKKDFKK